MTPLLILRPQPGANATAHVARDAGFHPILCPLFTVEPAAWTVPDASPYDALLLTSANALRHGGAGLAALTALPVIAVGTATAEAARNAGFTVVATGDEGVAALLATTDPAWRLLHLSGADHVAVAASQLIDRHIVYRAVTLDDPHLPPLAGVIILVHSRRAGVRLAELAGPDRALARVAAISAAAAEACGPGWGEVAAAAVPDDASLLALAARLCQGPLR